MFRLIAIGYGSLVRQAGKQASQEKTEKHAWNNNLSLLFDSYIQLW